MTHAIRVHTNGGPEQLRWESIDIPPPTAGEVLVRNTAIGVNFIDTYHRSGLYPQPLPLIPGLEGAGVVEDVGPGVTGFQPGDRVAYVDPPGAYSERLLRPANRLIPLPAAIDDRLAAAAMLKGLTAEYLVRRTYPVRQGETVLVHAAAGGVGQILCQWAAYLGATVIGTVGNATKADVARQAGCHHVINTAHEQIPLRVREMTGGAGVPVVYDGVGRDTFADSIDCLAPRGLMVSYGNASGAVDPVSPILLSQKGSLFLTRPTLAHYIASADDLAASTAALFEVLNNGAVTVKVSHTYPLSEAARAHADLESRRTVGSCLLLP